MMHGIFEAHLGDETRMKLVQIKYLAFSNCIKERKTFGILFGCPSKSPRTLDFLGPRESAAHVFCEPETPSH